MYIQILCLSALFHSSIFAMRTTGVTLSSKPSSWTTKGFSYGQQQVQPVQVPQATVNSAAASQVQAEMQDSSAVLSAAPWTMKRFMTLRPSWWSRAAEQEQVQEAPNLFKDFLQKYHQHERWLQTNVDSQVLNFFSPLLDKYSRAHKDFVSSPTDENAQQALIDMSAHMDQFIKNYYMNRPMYAELAKLSQSFIDNDQNTLEIRNHGLQGIEKMEKVLRDYKYGSGAQRFAAQSDPKAEQKGPKLARDSQSGIFKGSGIQRMYNATTL